MPAWSEIIKAQGKEELNRLRYQQKMISNQLKARELAIKQRLDQIDYLEKVGVDASRVLPGQSSQGQIAPPQPPVGGQNQVGTPTNVPYIGQ